ncbi:MAG: hypothetical protein IJ031_07185 [Oscillospiraceae bacterium]|nr:hypothetical protein [Oscillospiraceae bacterium]
MKHFISKNKQWFFLALWGIVSLIIATMLFGVFTSWDFLFLTILLLVPLNSLAFGFFHTRYNGIQPALLIPIIITALVYIHFDVDFKLHLIYVGAIVVGAFLGRLYIKKEDENNEN